MPFGSGFMFGKKALIPAVTTPAKPFLILADSDLSGIKEIV